MTTIDALARQPHYLDHIAPVWLALPPDQRGQFMVPSELRDRAARYGIEAAPVRQSTRPRLVAGITDVIHWTTKQAILMEHGAGQTYAGIRNGSYAGGVGRQKVSLFLCPSERVAAANRAAYPNKPAAVIGSPRLDRWITNDRPRRQQSRPTVAISFHWDCRAVPETRSGYPYFAPGLTALAETGWRILGHGHPRAFDRIAEGYLARGIELEPNFDGVMRVADLYVCDNSSTLFEFAATGRPVVVLNPPEYRRDVVHGVRFWEYADVGVNCDSPFDLVDACRDALRDTPARAERRREISLALFDRLDGHASQRAADAIAEFVQ